MSASATNGASSASKETITTMPSSMMLMIGLPMPAVVAVTAGRLDALTPCTTNASSAPMIAAAQRL